MIDGDTVRVDASADMPPELTSLAVRLRGADTPEKGRWAKCKAERQAAVAATAFTKRSVNRAERIIDRKPFWGNTAAESPPI